MNIKISYSVISIDSIKQILYANYNFEFILYCEFIQSSLSDIYRIITNKNTYYFKIYFMNTKLEKDLKFEIEIMNKLKKYDICCFPIESNKNNYIIKLNCLEGSRYAILLSNIKGKELNYNINESSKIYGKYIALLHKNLDKITTIESKNFNLLVTIDDSIDKIVDFLNYKKHEINFFFKIKEKIILNLNRISLDEFDFGICHNDLHGGNSFLEYNKLKFYDFDFCSYNYRIYDLAVFYWSCLNRKNKKQWDCFINSYKYNKNINLYELEYIDIFSAIRDLMVIALYIDKTSKLGTSFLNESFLNNRINFLTNLKLK